MLDGLSRGPHIKAVFTARGVQEVGYGRTRLPESSVHFVDPDEDTSSIPAAPVDHTLASSPHVLALPPLVSPTDPAFSASVDQLLAALGSSMDPGSPR